MDPTVAMGVFQTGLPVFCPADDGGWRRWFWNNLHPDHGLLRTRQVFLAVDDCYRDFHYCALHCATAVSKNRSKIARVARRYLYGGIDFLFCVADLLVQELV